MWVKKTKPEQRNLLIEKAIHKPVKKQLGADKGRLKPISLETAINLSFQAYSFCLIASTA